MDFLFFLPIIIFMMGIAFQAGHWSASQPTEDEMVRRIKEMRFQRKLKNETNAEVDNELISR